MPIGTCRDCGNMVSTSADACPKCGAKDPAARFVKVTVIRPKRFSGMALRWDFSLDGTSIGKLGNGETMDLSINSGPHNFSANMAGFVRSINVVLEENQEYEVTLQPGFPGPTMDVAKI